MLVTPVSRVDVVKKNVECNVDDRARRETEGDGNESRLGDGFAHEVESEGRDQHTGAECHDRSKNSRRN